MKGDPATVRAALQARLDALDAESRINKDARDTVALDQQSVGRLSRMDAMQQQAMAEAQERERARLRVRIEMALRRVDAGTYGECEECGEDIAPGRLKIDPAATLCVACQRMNET